MVKVALCACVNRFREEIQEPVLRYPLGIQIRIFERQIEFSLCGLHITVRDCIVS